MTNFPSKKKKTQIQTQDNNNNNNLSHSLNVKKIAHIDFSDEIRLSSVSSSLSESSELRSSGSELMESLRMSGTSHAISSLSRAFDRFDIEQTGAREREE